MIIDSQHEIELYRLQVLKSALKMEILGMKRRGRSAYSIIKEELNIKGNRQKVLKQLEEMLVSINKERGMS